MCVCVSVSVCVCVKRAGALPALTLSEWSDPPGIFSPTESHLQNRQGDKHREEGEEGDVQAGAPRPLSLCVRKALLPVTHRPKHAPTLTPHPGDSTRGVYVFECLNSKWQCWGTAGDLELVWEAASV